METPDAQPAASSPAPISGQTVIDTMSAPERETWQKTGDLPERVSVRSTKDAPAASSTAEPVEQAASTDASTPRPASEPGQPVADTGKPEKGAKLKARNAALDEENRQLQERLKLRHALREELARTEPKTTAKTDAASGSSPAPGPWDGSDPRDPKPQDTDPQFETHAAYLDARDAWNERRIERRQMAERQMSSRIEGIQRMGQSATERVQAYQAAHPDFDVSSLDERLLAIPPASAVPDGTPIGPHHALAEEILKSPVTPQLLQHFSTDEGRADWRRLCAMPPSDLLRAFGRLEARFEADASAGTGPLAPKTRSSAPLPPTTVGDRPADAGDPLESAVKRKDPGAYIREANKRALAALGG